MAYFTARRKSYTYSPADRTANSGGNGDTLCLLKKGDRIVFGHIEKLTKSSTANTIAVGVSSAAGGGGAGSLLAANDSSSGSVGDLANMVGADLATGGFLCTADGIVRVDYVAVGGGGTVTPKYRITIAKVDHEHIN